MGTSKVHLGAQNCYAEEKGAYTGEISAEMLKSVGVEYLILGHSERRAYFNESGEMLTKKVDIALSKDLTPIFCFGEVLFLEYPLSFLVLPLTVSGLLCFYLPRGLG